MNRYLVQLEIRFRTLLDKIFQNGGPKWPPLAWNLAATESTSVSDNIRCRTRPNEKRSRFEELFGVDIGILWGCPTHKTPRPVKMKKRYGYFKLWRWKTNLVPCQNCGAWHELHTICGSCYDKVRKETEAVKSLYVGTGSVPTEEAILLYNNEKLPEGEFWKGKRIIEMKKDRPLWFNADLKKRWHKLLSPSATDSSSKSS